MKKCRDGEDHLGLGLENQIRALAGRSIIPIRNLTPQTQAYLPHWHRPQMNDDASLARQRLSSRLPFPVRHVMIACRWAAQTGKQPSGGADNRSTVESLSSLATPSGLVLSENGRGRSFPGDEPSLVSHAPWWGSAACSPKA